MSGWNKCMFQYATRGKIYYNTGLITEGKALKLWEENKPDFIERLENGEDPEMCIWINCEDNGDYHTARMHVDCDSVAKNGDLYNLEKVGLASSPK